MHFFNATDSTPSHNAQFTSILASVLNPALMVPSMMGSVRRLTTPDQNDAPNAYHGA